MVLGWDRPWIGRKVGSCAAALWLCACGGDSTSASGSSSSESSASAGGTSSTGSSSSEGDAPDSSESESSGDLPVGDPELAGPGIAAGEAFSCSVADGTLTCWGEGGSGQLGDGTTHGKAPVAIATDHAWESVELGSDFACALDADRALWCWGFGADGRIPDGHAFEFPIPLNLRPEPIAIAEGEAWARVALGETHGCGVQTNGTLWCWGSNASGEIGDGAVGGLYTRLFPTEVGGDHWLDVYAGDRHTCGLRSDNVVACWGAGSELGVEGLDFSSIPVALDIPVPIRALARGGGSRHTCAIDTNDHLWCWGSNDEGQLGQANATGTTPTQLAGADAFVEVVTGNATTCARRMDGAVLCFGSGSAGQLGDGMAGPGHASVAPIEVAPGTAFTSIAVGVRHACARRDDGVDLCWGANDRGEIGDGTSGVDNARLQPTEVGPWGGGPVATDWSSVALGDAHGCGIRGAGELWCWGARLDGAHGNGDAAEGCSIADPGDCVATTPVPSAAGVWHALSVGNRFACALQDDDSLWCWGSNAAGQLGDDVVESSAVPLQIGDATDWIGVDAGAGTVCGIRSPGTLWCWGSDGDGVLGQGTIDAASTTPLQVGSESDWITVQVGTYQNVCGLRSGGALACWGRNDAGQLASGNDGEPVATPTPIAGTWSAIAMGRYHVCGIRQDGTLWCWGDGSSVPVQLGIADDWTSIQAGEVSTCALRSDGTAWCWGSNYQGSLGNGTLDDVDVETPTMIPGITDWVALAGSSAAYCGLRSDGIAWCWGANGYGQQGNDTIFVSGTPREVRDDG